MRAAGQRRGRLSVERRRLPAPLLGLGGLPPSREHPEVEHGFGVAISSAATPRGLGNVQLTVFDVGLVSDRDKVAGVGVLQRRIQVCH